MNVQPVEVGALGHVSILLDHLSVPVHLASSLVETEWPVLVRNCCIGSSSLQFSIALVSKIRCQWVLTSWRQQLSAVVQEYCGQLPLSMPEWFHARFRWLQLQSWVCDVCILCRYKSGLMWCCIIWNPLMEVYPINYPCMMELYWGPVMHMQYFWST